MPQQPALAITHIPTSDLKPAEYNPRKHSAEQTKQLLESIKRFGLVDPIIVNGAPERHNVVIGGHFRLEAAKELGHETVPVVYVHIPDIEKEKELNLRLNKNTGEFDLGLLAEFDETFLFDVGFSSEDLDDIFPAEESPEVFDLKKELEKLQIENVTVQKGDVYELGGSRVMCGDSTIEEDVMKLLGGEQADLCLTDPPYILDYLHGKKKGGEAVTGFGAKRDRRYLETDVLPPDFTEKWMKNVSKAAKKDFAIICYENWKNIRTIWGEMEKYWKVKNMIVWHLPNRHQGYASKYKFFSKHDIAMVGASGQVPYNLEDEEEPLQETYEAALFATGGKPHWEAYENGKKDCPTDFIEYVASDEEHSGQGVVFGTKPIEILMPYIKVLTERDALVLEPFGGSGSTLIAAIRLKRRCFLMEKCPTYAQVILKRWENQTGEQPRKIA